jgi:hypothetical protein
MLDVHANIFSFFHLDCDDTQCVKGGRQRIGTTDHHEPWPSCGGTLQHLSAYSASGPTNVLPPETPVSTKVTRTSFYTADFNILDLDTKLW